MFYAFCLAYKVFVEQITQKIFTLTFIYQAEKGRLMQCLCHFRFNNA